MATTPPTPDDSMLAALLVTALGSLATVYQDAILVVVGALFGALLSLQRAPTREWWRAIWHVVQCLGLALLLTDAGVAAVLAEAPEKWGLSRHTILAGVALSIAWAWPDRAAAGRDWTFAQLRAWFDRRTGGGGNGGGST